MVSETQVVEVGSKAPDFRLESSDGTLISLSQYLNRQNVVLFFMREFT